MLSATAPGSGAHSTRRPSQCPRQRHRCGPVPAVQPARIPNPTPHAGHDAVAEEVRHLIADIGGYTIEEIDPNALLGEDLGYDSLLQLRLIERLRTEYPQLEDVTRRRTATQHQ